jgi:hypothetical protein
MFDQITPEEQGHTLLVELMNNIVETDSIKTELHPINHPRVSINTCRSLQKTDGINIPDGQYENLVGALQKEFNLDKVITPQSPFGLADFRMKVGETLHLFVITVDPISGHASSIVITRK